MEVSEQQIAELEAENKKLLIQISILRKEVERLWSIIQDAKAGKIKL